MKDFLERNGVGLVFDDFDEMALKLKDGIEGIRTNVRDSRHRFTVEANIGKVIQHYKEISSSSSETL